MRILNPLISLGLALVTLVWSVPSVTVAQPSGRGDPMEVRAFREYLSLSSLAQNAEILQSNVSCGDRVCLQLGLVGLSRDRLFSQLSGLVTGFGYGADVVHFSLTSSQIDFASATVQLAVPVGGAKLDSPTLAQRAQRLLQILRAVSSLSARGITATSPAEIPKGAQVFLLSTLLWQDGGQTGVVRLLAPPESPKPVRPESPGRCPVWKLSPLASPAHGPFQGWLPYDLSWSFDCPGSKATVQ